MISPRTAILVVSLALAPLSLSSPATSAAAEGAVTWHLEQPKPPKPPPGVSESQVPIALGAISDIEFWAPNRGLLLTAGNPPTIPPGVWAYNGVEWHELATVCGATVHGSNHGSIAWAGPEDFWTVSDGRPGQVAESGVFREPPLEDNTLCHFSGGHVVASYAHPAFQADSYQAMRAAGCIPPSPPAATSTDCWFAGDPLPEPQIGAFQLHWNGSTLEAEPYPGEGHPVEDLRLFGGHLYESVRLSPGDRVAKQEVEPSVIHGINRERVLPTFEPEKGVISYGFGEFPEALGFLHLSAADGSLWGAAGSVSPAELPENSAHGEVTVVRRSAEGTWSQLIGPAPAHPLGKDLFPEEASLLPEGAERAAVTSIAAEPGTNSAWLGLAPQEARSPTARAVILRISAEGKVSEAQTLPSAEEQLEGIGPKGEAARLACPAVNDCWLATTQGWLFHLAPEGERHMPVDTDPAFANLITYRPPDLGLPQVPPDAPPPDTSGLVEEPPSYGGAFAESSSALIKQKISVSLLSNLHSRLLHGSTLELRFHLAVKASVRLLAKRHKSVVASTPTRTLAAGNRKLLLRLNPHSWPTKLDLQTHALAPLPTVTVNQPVGGPEHGGVGANTVGTGLTVLPNVPSFAGFGSGSESPPRSRAGSGSFTGSGSLP